MDQLSRALVEQNVRTVPVAQAQKEPNDSARSERARVSKPVLKPRRWMLPSLEKEVVQNLWAERSHGSLSLPSRPRTWRAPLTRTRAHGAPHVQHTSKLTPHHHPSPVTAPTPVPAASAEMHRFQTIRDVGIRR